MAVVYRVDLEDTTGTVVAQFQDFRSLNIVMVWNGKGRYQLVLSGFDDRIRLFGEDFLVRVWMRDVAENIDWLNIFTGIHKTPSESLNSNGNRGFQSFGPAPEELLAQAEILYFAGEDSKARKSGVSSTVMHEYVQENIGTLATLANGRIVDHVLSVLSQAPDTATGPTWDGSRAFKNLLDIIREIAVYSREQGDAIDFRVNYLGGYLFEFEAGKLGVDRTTTGLDPTTGLNGAGNVPVVFAPQFGNVSSLNQSKSRFNESNVVIALGQGEGDQRGVQVAIDAISTTVSPIAKRESTINSTDDPTNSELLAVADAALRERIAEEKINFVPRRGAQIFFRDYFIGDFVTAENLQGIRFDKQIIGATIGVAPTDTGDVENISLEFADV